MWDDEALVEDQIEYYRARAGEYDQWFRREGRYDRGVEANRRWFTEVEQVRDRLDAAQPKGQVLELAGGTGLWTQHLIRHAERVTVVDSAAEALAINRARAGNKHVSFVQADLFSWQPSNRYDFVFFGFWLSHVPPGRFAGFWDTVRSCLRPGGRIFFVDSLYAETSTALDHRLEGPEARSVTRRLNDGREYRIVKVFYTPEDLQVRLAGLCWDVTVRATPTYFLYGVGTPANQVKEVRR